MDGGKKSWAWMQEHMPRTVGLLREKRAAGQGALIDECWKRGVVMGESGWFWATEGAVSIGVPPEGALVPPEVLALMKAFPTRVALFLRGEAVNAQ